MCDCHWIRRVGRGQFPTKTLRFKVRENFRHLNYLIPFKLAKVDYVNGRSRQFPIDEWNDDTSSGLRRSERPALQFSHLGSFKVKNTLCLYGSSCTSHKVGMGAKLLKQKSLLPPDQITEHAHYTTSTRQHSCRYSRTGWTKTRQMRENCT
jgi:hypothetical protein